MLTIIDVSLHDSKAWLTAAVKGQESTAKRCTRANLLLQLLDDGTVDGKGPDGSGEGEVRR